MLKYKKHPMYLCVKMKFISSWILLPSHVYRLMYMNFGPIDYLILHVLYFATFHLPAKNLINCEVLNMNTSFMRFKN